MNLYDFTLLEGFEKDDYRAKLIHAATNDDALFKMGIEIINLGKRKGLFDNVKFGREISIPAADPEDLKTILS